MFTDFPSVLLFLIQAILMSSGFGALVALVIQIGKAAIPGLFADGTAQNFRLFLALLVAVFLFAAPVLGLHTTIEQVDAFMTSLASLGVILFPLIVALVDWAAKTFYRNTLKGAALVGASHTLSPSGKSAKK